MQGESLNKQKGNGGEGSKPPPPAPYSPPSSPPSTPSCTPPRSQKGHAKSPLLKLDVKFEFPIFNGEVNVEKLDNWVRKIEFYCKIQRIKNEVTKIHLSSFHLESETLIWWEARTQEDLNKSAKIISSWNDFVATLRRKFYPLAYIKK